MGDSAHLTAAEAAAVLGVKLATIYAYVSRGLIRSERIAPGRQRRYRRDDVLRLKRRAEVRADPGTAARHAFEHSAAPILDSSLTLITETGAVLPRTPGDRAGPHAHVRAGGRAAVVRRPRGDGRRVGAAGAAIRGANVGAVGGSAARTVVRLSIGAAAAGRRRPGRGRPEPGRRPAHRSAHPAGGSRLPGTSGGDGSPLSAGLRRRVDWWRAPWRGPGGRRTRRWPAP